MSARYAMLGPRDTRGLCLSNTLRLLISESILFDYAECSVVMARLGYQAFKDQPLVSTHIIVCLDQVSCQ